jgi:hypothetical protein
LFDPEYFHVFADMAAKFPNLYGDTSAFNVPLRGRHIRECLKEPVVSRLLHGSDYPVPVHGHWSWLRRQVSWDAFRRWEKQSNVLERDYQLKLAAGFPPEVFTRMWSLLPQSVKKTGLVSQGVTEKPGEFSN